VWAADCTGVRASHHIPTGTSTSHRQRTRHVSRSACRFSGFRQIDYQRLTVSNEPVQTFISHFKLAMTNRVTQRRNTVNYPVIAPDFYLTTDVGPPHLPRRILETGNSLRLQTFTILMPQQRSLHRNFHCKCP